MNFKNYLTDNLYIFNKKLYNEHNNKVTKINNRNWFKYVKEYGWEKINCKWEKKLNSNKFCVLECGADGDCLFHVISEALNYNEILNYEVPKYDVSVLRNYVCDMININNFDSILNFYKLEKNLGEFNGDWDPFNINTIDEFKNEIIKGGDNFWGDHILLQLLQKKMDINIIILNTINDYSNEKETLSNLIIQNLDLDKINKTIILYLEDEHFKLVGFFDGNMIRTYFNHKDIPKCILNND